MKNPIFEACVETVEQAILAEKNGADRVELCSDLSIGGITPSLELLEKTIASISIPIMAMARPRGGNFVHSKEEIEEIKKAIDLFKSLNIKGVVFGFLTKANEIDFQLTKKMVEFAYPLEVTFHKAIDMTPDPVESIKLLSKLKDIQRVLTSGGKSTAIEGKEVLIKMQKAVEEKMNIIVAGKVTIENRSELHQLIGAKEYHGRRIVF